MEEQKNVVLAFAATDKTIVKSIPTLVEDDIRGKGYINYGTDNQYPEYLYGLYNDCTTLKTVVEGTSDFVTGNDTICNVPGFEKEVNRKGDTIRDLIKWCSRDWLIYGSFCIQVIRNKAGKVSELYYIDMRHMRSDKYNEAFFYSEEFNKKYARTSKVLVYPKFIPENVNIPTSIMFVKNNTTGTYAVPKYSGAIRACEIERNIDELHLNGLENGFMGSYLISFLNGIPTDDQKHEIEKNIQEKFCGTANTGRVVINFANSKDNGVQLQKLEAVDFADKYDAAAKRSREQIYAAFQANPNLFGIMTENTGFSLTEFEEAFKLYNRTIVKSIQRKISETLDKIFGMEGSVSIEPFTLEDKTEETVE